MPVQRAVAYGTIASVVQIRSMFTCQVVESGGDTSAILWDAYMSSFFDELMDLLADTVTYYQYEVQEYSAGHWTPIDVVIISRDGANSGDSLPNAVAVVLLGIANGLRHIGRKFLSGLPENLVDANLLVGGGITQAAACLLAYITPFTGIGGGTIDPGILDKAGTFHAFVGGVVSAVLGSMRRRKPGVGI